MEEKLLGFVLVYKWACTELHGSDSFGKGEGKGEGEGGGEGESEGEGGGGDEGEFKDRVKAYGNITVPMIMQLSFIRYEMINV